MATKPRLPLFKVNPKPYNITMLFQLLKTKTQKTSLLFTSFQVVSERAAELFNMADC